MHYFLLIYFNSKPLHVSSRLATHHQEDQLCINSNWYSHAFMLTGCWQQPIIVTHDYTNCCLYRVDPPDDEHQSCSKHVEAYYWNKLIENSASCWFMLYGYVRYTCRRFNNIWIFSRDFHKCRISNFTKIRLLRAEFMHADRQLDRRHDEAYRRFSRQTIRA